jgi:hypothetical protein
LEVESESSDLDNTEYASHGEMPAAIERYFRWRNETISLRDWQVRKREYRRRLTRWRNPSTGNGTSFASITTGGLQLVDHGLLRLQAPAGDPGAG